MTTFGVALFVNGKFEGRVAAGYDIADLAQARKVAKLWIDSHDGKHDYRPVEFGADGLPIAIDGRTC